MTIGFGILFAVVGFLLWLWAWSSTTGVESHGAAALQSLLIDVGFFFAVGWLLGFAIKKIRHG